MRTFAILIALFLGHLLPAQDNRMFDEEALRLRDAIRSGDQGALQKLRTLAEEGSPHAQLILASTYEGSDQHEWLRWNLAAAIQGQPVAQTNVGGAYSRGDATEKDREKAIFWLRMAADQGQWLGAGTLGDLYRGERRDQPGDFVQAYRWYTVGADILREAGRNDILETMLSRRAFIAKSMTTTQIAEAESLAAQWDRKDWSELEPRLAEQRR